MIHIGAYQTLTIKRTQPQGFYLEDAEGNEVLMPRAYITEDMEIEDEVEVFVYTDAGGESVATTENPQFVVNQFAYLYITEVNEIGAFCDWGVMKELFVPFRNQAGRLQEGHRVVVYMYLDGISNRLVGTTKLNKYLQQEADESLQMGQEVELLVYSKTELGYKVIVNQQFSGLVYENETYQPLRMGQTLKGYLKPIREDKKLDISLSPIGHQSIEPNAQKILARLKQQKGFLPFTDKSDPVLIRKEFGISKKLFKKAIGALYREQIVRLEQDGIYLNERRR